MIKLYLSSVIRNLGKNRAFTALNLICLSIGLTTFLLIVLYVVDEYSYDTHWRDADRLYRITQTSYANPDNAPQSEPYISMQALPQLSDYFPQIIQTGTRRVETFGSTVEINDVALAFEATYVDEAILGIFEFDTVAGDLSGTFDSRGNIALSEASAMRLFGRTDVLGKTLSYRHLLQEEEELYNVTAVYRLKEGNTAVRLDSMILLDETYLMSTNPFRAGWAYPTAETFVKLVRAADAEAMAALLPAFIDRYVSLDDLPAGARTSAIFQYGVQPVSDIYFNGPYPYLVDTERGDKATVRVFLSVALLVLAIALINFFILSGTRFNHRIRELGIRKIIGATLTQIVLLFYSESFWIGLTSLMLSLMLMALSYGVYSQFAGTPDAVGFSGVEVAFYSILILAGITFVGGLYALFRLPRLKPYNTVLGGRSAYKRIQAALVTFQLTVSVILAITSVVMFTQLRAMQARDPGFRTDNILVTGLGGIFVPEIRAIADVLKNEVQALPSVESAAFSTLQPMLLGGGMDIVNTMRPAPADSGSGPVQVHPLLVGYDFFATYEMALVAGRLFQPERDAPEPWDGPGEGNFTVVVNRAAAALLGSDSPADIVGRTVVTGTPGTPAYREYTVIGVVENTQFRNLRAPPMAEVFHLVPEQAFWLSVGYAGDPAVLQAGMEAIWREYLPARPFGFNHVAQSVAQSYADERDQSRLILVFTAVSLVLTLIGFYSVIAFDLTGKVKEVGIRKALGATSAGVIRMFLTGYFTNVLLAVAIAWPVTFLLTRNWLSRFPYQIMDGLIFTIYLASSLVFVLLCVLTVLYRIHLSAGNHPVNALYHD